VAKGKDLRRGGKFRPEAVGLKLRQPGQISAADAGWKSKEVFDKRGRSRLTTGRIPLQDNGVQSFRSGINCRSQSGRTGTDNCNVGENLGFIFRPERTQ